MNLGQTQTSGAAAAFVQMIELARTQRLSVTDLFGLCGGALGGRARAEAVESTRRGLPITKRIRSRIWSISTMP